MVPRESGRGASFKGAGLYYLHDKNALTTERIAFTHCENLPTQDPQKALGWMAWTCKIAPELKAAAGVSPTGRKSTGRPVYTVALSWHPEQRPTRESMIEQGRAWLAKQGLSEHQAVMVCHADRKHPHLHLIINLVHPQTGRVATLAFSKLKSSSWAEDFEKASGKVYCEERVKNNERREKEKESPLTREELKAKITAVYGMADSGKSFVGAMRAEGLEVARGGRIVVLDLDGKIHNLARLIDGKTEKAIRQRLAGVALPSVETAKARQEARGSGQRSSGTSTAGNAEYHDRDAEDQAWQESIIDAALHHDPYQVPAPPEKRVSAQEKNALQSRQHEEKAALQARHHEARLQQATDLKRIYGDQEKRLTLDIKLLESRLSQPGKLRRWVRVATGQEKLATERLIKLRSGLSNVEWRKAELREGFAAEADREEAALTRKHEREWKELILETRPPLPPAPKPGYDQSLTQAYQQALTTQRRTTGVDRPAPPQLGLER